MVHHLSLQAGRLLEVYEYGDPRGHPVIFFHGLIGSHHQASYIAAEARENGLCILAPNRPGVGKSDFIRRKSPLETVSDVEEIALALDLETFSVMGISGGTPYALASLERLGSRVLTATLISGMGPMRLPGALKGMRSSDRIGLEIGSRQPLLARRVFEKWSDHFRAHPDRFLDRFIDQLVAPDRFLFRTTSLYDLFRQDLHQVFVEGQGAESLAHELRLYRYAGFSFGLLPKDRRVVLWHGLNDDLVPPAMAWALSRYLPNCEVHLVPGGHFVAVEIAGRIIARLRELIESSHG